MQIYITYNLSCNFRYQYPSKIADFTKLEFITKKEGILKNRQKFLESTGGEFYLKKVAGLNSTENELLFR